MYQGDKVLCDMCDEVLQASKHKKVAVFAHENGWDWFTGNETATFHACPQCRTTRAEEFLASLTESGAAY